MNKLILASMAVGTMAQCGAIDLARKNWKVPNWSTVVSAPGAVREFIGRTWSGHVQGIVQFGELKDGVFSDLTLYGGFNKYIER